MTDRTIRSALDAAANLVCEQSTPCFSCRMATRDVVLKFLAELPDQFVAVPPFGLRAMVVKSGSDA